MAAGFFPPAQSVSDNEVREKINYNGNGTSGSVTYSYLHTKSGADNRKDVDLDFGLEFSSDGRFLLRYRDNDQPQGCFELTQVPGQPVRLSLPPAMPPKTSPARGESVQSLTDEKPRVVESPTVWHLLLVHGDECGKGLLPRLEALRPDWRIAATLAAAEDELVKLAATAERPDRRQWAEWVKQLGDPLCTRRERAERKLREAGPAVLAFLNRQSMGLLDAEQQLRIRRVVRVLSTQQGEDTPENIAALLIGDPHVWLTLLSAQR